MKLNLNTFKALLAFLLIFCFLNGFSQYPQVPSKMQFADMELIIAPAAKQKIQASVDELFRSTTHFQIKVDRAHLYFPYIEEAFRMENLPADFKYLVLQESGLVSDAVSSSNAIGFWQFKEPAAKEVGLTIDSRMDERKHIIRASQGAARYLKQNNMHFGNWIYALQAYNTGAGGAKQTTNPEYYGKKRMEINATTHWYVLKFLAHKIAFDDAFRQVNTQTLSLVEYRTKGESLAKIASKFSVSQIDLKTYNKWLNTASVPDDREYYSIMIPVLKAQEQQAWALAGKNVPQQDVRTEMDPTEEDVEMEVVVKEEQSLTEKEMPDWFKKRKPQETTPNEPHILVKLNGLLAIKAKEGDTKDVLAINGGISTPQFLQYNDMKSFHKIKAGNYYYLQKKKSKHFAKFHIVQPKESLWGISQHYGIRLNALLHKNRMDKYEQLKYGRELWLKETRPKDTPIKYVEIKIEEKPAPKPEEKREIKKAEDVLKNLPDEHKTIDTNEVRKEVEKEFESGLQNTGKTAIYHIVKQGEGLYGISKKYNTTTEQIMEWNGLSAPTISIEQKLIVGYDEKPKLPDTGFIMHTVKQGETLFSISKKYEVPMPMILQWNNKTEETLRIDEQLKIYKYY